MSLQRIVSLVVIAASVFAQGAGAQRYASEHAMVAQTVNGTTITVDYYRPEARGRELFGKQVRWGREWTPGANWGTTIEVDHDVTLEGKPLPKGKYSVWVVPQPEEWTVRLSRKSRVFHTLPPGADEDQLRFTVKPVQGPHVEVLTWSFPAVTRGPELHMQWGTVDLPLHLAVDPVAATTLSLTAEQRARYTGVYAIDYKDRRLTRRSRTYTVFDSAGVLRLRREVAPDNLYDAQYDLHPTGEHTFVPIMYKQGVLFGVEPAMTVVFSMENGHASALEVRGPGGGPLAKGMLEKQ